MNDDLCSLIVILILLAALIFMAFVFFQSIPSQTLNWTIN
jgi:hypothetical protein